MTEQTNEELLRERRALCNERIRERDPGVRSVLLFQIEEIDREIDVRHAAIVAAAGHIHARRDERAELVLDACIAVAPVPKVNT